jgi:TrmH family RNA methyltransferase
MVRVEITSLQNPKAKQALHLRERRERNKTQLFLIEGYRELLRAVEAGQSLELLFVSPPLFLGSHEDDLIRQIAASTPVYECSKEVFSKLSYRDRPDGLLAIGRQTPRGKVALKSLLSNNECDLLVVAEAIEKPGNLGTILRSCDAGGVNALVVTDPTTDIYNPNVVRASVGTLFTVPVFVVPSEELYPILKGAGILLIATEPQAQREFTQVDLTQKVALLVGTEQYGLSSFSREQADLSVNIPMFGKADSLNVATATTLMIYEAIRQRRSSLH